MLKRILTIALLYLKTTYASRTTLLFSLAMPLLFTLVLGQAMANLGPGEGQIQIPLAVVDEDESEISRRLVDRLRADPAVGVRLFEKDLALAELEEILSAAIVIPSGFAEDLRAGESVELLFYQNANEIRQAQLLLESVNAAAAQLAGSFAAADLSARVADRAGLFAAADPQVEADYRAEAFTRAEDELRAGEPVTVETQTVSRLEQASSIPTGASQSSPGMLVMYALFFTFGGGASLLVERDEGTLRRLLVMPMGKGTLMAGKLLGIYLGSLIQMAIMVLAGQFAFGVKWGQDPAALALMLLAYGLTSTALGLLMAALSKTAAQVNAAGTIVTMALASLGGAWWPIEIVPGWMQSFALALPTGWAMRGFHDIITRGLGLSAVWPEAGILIGFAAVFFGIGIWRFRYE